MEKKLELKDIVLIGRTFREYYRMFSLQNLNKDERILDVASGVSSFCAEAAALGYNVTACDRIYRFPADEIERKCRQDLDSVMQKLPGIMDLYKWEFFRNIEDLKQNRKQAYELFIKDYREKGAARYVYAEFPESEFADDSYTTSLVSHFLFLYDEHLDYEFHKKTITELLRITSNKIRIFPLVNLKGMKSLFVERVMNDPAFKSFGMEIQKTDYEFVKNGNEMLIIQKR